MMTLFPIFKFFLLVIELAECAPTAHPESNAFPKLIKGCICKDVASK